MTLASPLSVVPAHEHEKPLPDAMLTPKQVAEQLGHTIDHVYKLRRKHGLPLARTGGRALRIRQADLDRWIAARTEAEAGEPAPEPVRLTTTG